METALEHILTNTYKLDMIAYMAAHPDAFQEAVQLAVSDKQPYAWRAAWLLWSCMNENDDRIKGHIKNIISTLKTKNDDHQRELLKILLNMELNEKTEGYLFDFCISVWEKINKKPSVRFTAFKVILKIARNHPDLSQEITFLTQSQYLDSLSPAAQKSIIKMLKGFNRQVDSKL